MTSLANSLPLRSSLSGPTAGHGRSYTGAMPVRKNELNVLAFIQRGSRHAIDQSHNSAKPALIPSFPRLPGKRHSELSALSNVITTRHRLTSLNNSPHYINSTYVRPAFGLLFVLSVAVFIQFISVLAASDRPFHVDQQSMEFFADARELVANSRKPIPIQNHQ